MKTRLPAPPPRTAPAQGPVRPMTPSPRWVRGGDGPASQWAAMRRPRGRAGPWGPRHRPCSAGPPGRRRPELWAGGVWAAVSPTDRPTDRPLSPDRRRRAGPPQVSEQRWPGTAGQGRVAQVRARWAGGASGPGQHPGGSGPLPAPCVPPLCPRPERPHGSPVHPPTPRPSAGPQAQPAPVLASWAAVTRGPRGGHRSVLGGHSVGDGPSRRTSWEVVRCPPRPGRAVFLKMFCWFFFLEARSHSVARAGLKVRLSCLSLPSAELTGPHHGTPPSLSFFFNQHRDFEVAALPGLQQLSGLCGAGHIGSGAGQGRPRALYPGRGVSERCAGGEVCYSLHERTPKGPRAESAPRARSLWSCESGGVDGPTGVRHRGARAGPCGPRVGSQGGSRPGAGRGAS